MATVTVNAMSQPANGERGAAPDPIGCVQRWSLGVVLATLAVFLVVMGSRFTLASLAGLAGEPVLSKLRDALPVTAHEAEGLLAAKQDELKWRANGEAAIDAGLARLLIAESLPADEKNRAHLVSAAVTDLKQGLMATPLSGRGWARLAYGLAALEGWSAAAQTALQFSIAAAPFEPSLMPFRLRMGFQAWPTLDARGRAAVLQQVRYAAKVDLRSLVLLAGQERAFPVVRAALRDEPHVLAEFERLRTQSASDRQRG